MWAKIQLYNYVITIFLTKATWYALLTLRWSYLIYFCMHVLWDLSSGWCCPPSQGTHCMLLLRVCLFRTEYSQRRLYSQQQKMTNLHLFKILHILTSATSERRLNAIWLRILIIRAPTGKENDFYFETWHFCTFLSTVAWPGLASLNWVFISGLCNVFGGFFVGCGWSVLSFANHLKWVYANI